MKNLTLPFVLSIFLFTHCRHEKQSSGKARVESVEKKLDMANHPGALTYKKFCVSCHQSNGEGLPGMYPPIAGTKMVNGDKNDLIGIILNGMSGEIEVKGESYNNVMPSHQHLTDNQIANLLTYIRVNFGNSSGAISADEVKQVRESDGL